MPTAVLKVPLGRPFQMPAERLNRILADVLLACNQARNAAATHWYVWRRQHPDWKPGDPYEPPAPKICRKKAAADQGRDPPMAPRLFLSRELYDVAAKAAPNVNRSVVSQCSRDVVSRLRAKVPYNHAGKARYVWQAVLSSEVSLSTWGGQNRGVIPVPRNCAVFGYRGHATNTKNADVARACQDNAVLFLPLLSKQSGYRTVSPLVRLNLGCLTRGHRRILQRIAAGDLRMADSKLSPGIVRAVGKRGSKVRWFLLLTYELPASAAQCDPERVLTITLAPPAAGFPFRLEWPDGSYEYKRGTKALLAEHRRIIARRRAIRWRYKDGAAKGRGRERFFRVLRPIGRAVKDLQDRWIKLFIADVIKEALVQNCGTIMIREPTMPVRDQSWFSTNHVPFPWTEFFARLRWKAESKGLVVRSAMLSMNEFRPKPKGTLGGGKEKRRGRRAQGAA